MILILLLSILPWQVFNCSIDPLIKQAILTSGSADILCILKSPNNHLDKITATLDTKDQKGEYVFNRLKTYADESQRRIQNKLKEDHIFFQSFYIVNAIHIPKATSDLIAYLSSRSEVERLEYNSNYTRLKTKEEPEDLQSLQSRSPSAIEWGILRIQADKLWELGIKGKGAVIGGEDTGVELHPLLKKSYRGTLSDSILDHNYNWHDAIHGLNALNHDANQNPKNNPCGLDTLGPCDDDNHGTHTMGTMVATDMQLGVAPESKWIACRCMERGFGGLVTYIECFQFFLAPTDLKNLNPDPKKAPHVINNSWACPTEEGCNPSNFLTMEQVVKNLKAAGIFVTVSAGNSGGLGCGSISDVPAIFEASFSVGATTNAFDTIAGFSSKGPVLLDNSMRTKPNLSAPGVGVTSTIRNGGFTRLSGTSMSGPHVSGAVALLISAFPSLAGKVDLLENILEQSAVVKIIKSSCGADSTEAIPNNVFGSGRLDVFKAYLLAKQLITTSVPVYPDPYSIKVYPNPADQIMWFELNAGDLATMITLVNIQGQVILQQKPINPSMFYLDVSTLPDGMYYYKLDSRQKVHQGKLLVAH